MGYMFPLHSFLVLVLFLLVGIASRAWHRDSWPCNLVKVEQSSLPLISRWVSPVFLESHLHLPVVASTRCRVTQPFHFRGNMILEDYTSLHGEPWCLPRKSHGLSPIIGLSEMIWWRTLLGGVVGSLARQGDNALFMLTRFRLVVAQAFRISLLQVIKVLIH